MAIKPRIRVPARTEGRKSLLTGDSFQNVIAHIGQQTANLSSAAGYGLNPVSRLRTTLEFMYRGSWLVRKVTDQPAMDMTRAGINIDSDMPPEEVETLHEKWRRLNIWDSLRDTIKWARLYGGAVAYIMIDGQDSRTPLRLNTIGPNAFKGLLVMDRWMVDPVWSETITELGPDIGKPMYYQTTMASEMPVMMIHHSRLIRFDGDPLPYWQAISENGWSASVVEQLYDRMVAFDSATQGAAQLVYKAHLRTYKVPGLREMIAAGGPQYQAFMASMNAIRLFQSNEGLTVIDGDDSIEYHTNSAFSGLSDALTQFGQQLSGACGIPLVILFGQSPSGFSTGETDVRNYYDRISAQQHSDLETPVQTLLSVLHWSVFQKPLMEGLSWTVNPLWQPTEKERAETAGSITQTVVQAHGEGLITTKAAMKELKQSSRETGVFSNITDEEIASADDTLPQPGEMGEEGMNPPGEAGPPGAQPGAAPAMPLDAKVNGEDGGPPAPASSPAGKPPAPKSDGLFKPDKEGMQVMQGTGENVRLRIHPGAMSAIKQKAS